MLGPDVEDCVVWTKSVQTTDCPLVKWLLSGSLHYRTEPTAAVTVLVLAAALPSYLRFRRRRRAS